MELTEVKDYLRVDYDDDDALINLMYDAIMDEMRELIPKFDADNLTNRQKLLILAYVKELYDNRGEMSRAISANAAEKVRFAVRSMMLKEMLR